MSVKRDPRTSDAGRHRQGSLLVAPSIHRATAARALHRAPRRTRSAATPVSVRSQVVEGSISVGKAVTPRSSLMSTYPALGSSGSSADGDPQNARRPAEHRLWDAIRFLFQQLAIDQTRRCSQAASHVPGLHTTIGVLPDELLLHTFGRLLLRDIFAASLVCRRWAAVTRDDSLWQLLCIREAGSSMQCTSGSWRRTYRVMVHCNCKLEDVGLDCDYSFYMKLVVVGDSGVGKSSFLHRLYHGSLPVEPTPTIGMDFKTKRVAFGADRAKLALWDTSGSSDERSRRIVTSVFRGAHGAWVMFDVGRRSSFMSVWEWFEMFNDAAHPRPDCVMLVGMKVDAVREVGADEALHVAEEMSSRYGKRVVYQECSCLTGHGVERVACLLASRVYAAAHND